MLTDAELNEIADNPVNSSLMRGLAMQLLALRAEFDDLRTELIEAQREIPLLVAEKRAVEAERNNLRRDLGVCADKLAVASDHLSLVAARQPERFWTRTPPTITAPEQGTP